MEKYLVFPDGGRFRLADITYEEFLLTDWEGTSDTEYQKYLNERDMHTLDEFLFLEGAKIILE